MYDADFIGKIIFIIKRSTISVCNSSSLEFMVIRGLQQKHSQHFNENILFVFHVFGARISNLRLEWNFSFSSMFHCFI